MHAGAEDCPRGVALLRLLVEMWGPCADALAEGLKAHKSGAAGRALMQYLRAALLGSASGMANAAHLLLSSSPDLDREIGAAWPQPNARVELARALLREAHGLGNTDASISLADELYQDASASPITAGDGGRSGWSAWLRTDSERRFDGSDSEREALYAEALSLYEMVARTVGDPEALYASGHMYQHGLGTAQDLDAASRIFQELADMDDLSEALPGFLAQLGVSVQRTASWLAGLVSHTPERRSFEWRSWWRF